MRDYVEKTSFTLFSLLHFLFSHFLQWPIYLDEHVMYVAYGFTNRFIQFKLNLKSNEEEKAKEIVLYFNISRTIAL